MSFWTMPNMTGAPGDLVTETEQARCDSGNRSFAARPGRRDMRVDASRQIKQTLGGALISTSMRITAMNRTY